MNLSTCTTPKTKPISKPKPIGFYLLIKNINNFHFITMVKSIEVFIFTTLECIKMIWKIKLLKKSIVKVLDYQGTYVQKTRGLCNSPLIERSLSYPTGTIVEGCVFQQYDFWVSVLSYKSFRIFDSCNLMNFLYEFLSNVASLLNNACTSFHKLYRQSRNHLFSWSHIHLK